MKILLLDENEETYEVLKEVASLSGSEILYFNNIDDAKEYLTNNTNIDAVITEKYISNHSSGEIISFIKKLNLEVPIILLTSELSEDEKEFFKNLGVSEFVEKPFNPLEVISIAVECLKRLKGEEYVQERLHSEEETDRASLKDALRKIINFLKKLFFKK